MSNATTLRKAQILIYLGFASGVILVLTSTIGLVSLVGTKRLNLTSVLGILNLIDLVAVLLLSFGILRKSRVCAILLPLYYSLDQILTFMVGQLGDKNIIWNIIFGSLFICGIIGTFWYHRLRAIRHRSSGQHPGNGESPDLTRILSSDFEVYVKLRANEFLSRLKEGLKGKGFFGSRFRWFVNVTGNSFVVRRFIGAETEPNAIKVASGRVDQLDQGTRIYVHIPWGKLVVVEWILSLLLIVVCVMGIFNGSSLLALSIGILGGLLSFCLFWLAPKRALLKFVRQLPR